jgi:hypothetical protein
MQYMNIGGTEGEQNLKDIREQHIVRRSQRLRMLSGVLTPEAFAKRKAFFLDTVCWGCFCAHTCGAQLV